MTQSFSAVDFYRSKIRTAEGHGLKEILSWDDRAIESDHAFIQWLFPTYKKSSFNYQCPVLTREEESVFREDDLLQQKLLQSLDRMLDFYGLERTMNGIVKSSAWEEKSRNWLVQGDHNHLRITRILDSLTTLGLEQTALAFLACLEEIAASDEGSREIGSRTLDFWRRATLPKPG